MSEQPPVQPPNNPPPQPPNHPAEGNAPTQPMAASYGASPVGPTPAPATAYPPTRSRWHEVTSTPGRRWALAISAGAFVLLLFLGIGVAGLVVLRNHDRVDLLGSGQDGRSHGQYAPGNGNGNGMRNGNGNGMRKGNGNGQGPGADDGKDRGNLPGLPGMQGGRAQGLGGLGNLLGGGALHGDVTATANGSVQALVFQRGEVTTVSDTSITLKSSDGFVGTYGRTAATRSRGAALVNGGQAFVLARASDKGAITTLAMPAMVGAAPSS